MDGGGEQEDDLHGAVAGVGKCIVCMRAMSFSINFFLKKKIKEKGKERKERNSTFSPTISLL